MGRAELGGKGDRSFLTFLLTHKERDGSGDRNWGQVDFFFFFSREMVRGDKV